MRLGLMLERKEEFPFEPGDSVDLNSELFSAFEEDELLSGLRDAGYEVVRIGNARRLLNRVGYWRNRCDLVFNLSVGYRGIERKLLAPSILEVAGIPYVGSTPYALTLTRHKYHTKLLVASAGVPTPRSVLVTGDQAESVESLEYPVIIKPVAESSSIGIDPVRSVVQTPKEAQELAEHMLHHYRQPALVETFVHGVEIEVPILIDPEPYALGVVAISLGGTLVNGGTFLSSSSVYDDNYGFAEPPSFVDRELIAKLAVQGSKILGMRDYGRLDFRVTEDMGPYFIEASTHPHIQTHSSFFWLAHQRGLAYSEMLDEIISVARRRIF